MWSKSQIFCACYVMDLIIEIKLFIIHIAVNAQDEILCKKEGVHLEKNSPREFVLILHAIK